MIKQKKALVPIAKAAEPKLKQALYVVLEPDVVDAHGDTYDAEEVRKACHNFNRSKTVKSNLFHMVETDEFAVVESYVSPVEMSLNGEIIKAGTWLANLQFSDELWQAHEEGKFSGVSIGAMADVTDLED